MQHVSTCPSFSKLNHTPQHGWPTSCVSIHPSVSMWELLRLCYGEQGIGVQLSLRDPAFNPVGCIHRSRIAGSYDRPIFNCLRSLHPASHSGCTTLPFHQPCTRVPVCVHNFQHLLFSGCCCFFFFILVNLIGVSWHLTVLLKGICGFQNY